MDEDFLPDLNGKLLVLHVANAPKMIQGGLVLEHCSFETFNGRVFVVGREPMFGEIAFATHIPTAVPLDAVVTYQVVDSREDYIQRWMNVRR